MNFKNDGSVECPPAGISAVCQREARADSIMGSVLPNTLGRLLLASALVAPGLALAQNDQPGGDPNEITVTAQRREQSNLDVGINITQINMEKIQEAHVEDIADLGKITSGVEMRENRPGGLLTITIRGVGMNDFSIANNPSVSVYVDGVYSPNVGTIGGQLFDLQNVEILKGPQSTLYGRNATAGSVNITSARPTDYFTGYATTGYGNYNTFNEEGAVSGPISDELSGRLSLTTQQRLDGYMHNLYPGGQEIGTSNKTSGRAQLLWKPTDPLEVHATIGYAYEDDVPGAFTAFGIHNPGGTVTVPNRTLCPTYLAGQIDFDNKCASTLGYIRTSKDVYTLSENDSWAVKSEAFNATIDTSYTTDDYTIRSVTGYLHWQELYFKGDGIPLTEAALTLYEKTSQISEDLLIESNGDQKLNWIAGIYGAMGRLSNPIYNSNGATFSQLLSLNEQRNHTAQAYTQLDYDVTDELQLTAGARYIYEDDTKVGGSWRVLTNSIVVGPGATQLAYLNDQISQNAFTWKLGANYKFNSDSLIYASITHGFKSGGFTGSAVNATAQLLPYKGEDIYAYEIGAKQSLYGGKLELTGSLFYYDYDDLQTSQNIITNNIVITAFSNIPSSNLEGLDFDAHIRPIEGLDVGLSVGLLHTHLGAFAGTAGPVPAGNQFANAPKFIGTADVRYQWPLSDGLDAAVGLAVHRQGKVFADTANTPIYRIDSDSSLVDAHVDLMLPNSGWQLSLWGKNLTDDQFTNGSFATGNLYEATFNMPRTFGASLTKKF